MPIFIKTELIKKEYLIQKDIRKKIINEHIKWIENLKKNDNELCNNIDTLKNQILYNNQENEI